MSHQGNELVINLTSQGGGTVTLQDFNETDGLDGQFVFLADENGAMVRLAECN